MQKWIDYWYGNLMQPDLYPLKHLQQSDLADTGLWWRKVQCSLQGNQARRTDSSCSKDLNSVMAFRGGVLKAVWGRGPQSVWSAYAQFLDWLAWRWNLEHHQPFAFSHLGSLFLWSAVFVWRGSASCINYSEMCVWALSISFRELGVWCFYVVDFQSKLLPVSLPNSCSLFLHFHFS